MKELKWIFLAAGLVGLVACNNRGYYDTQYEPYQYEDARYYQPQGDLYLDYGNPNDSQYYQANPNPQENLDQAESRPIRRPVPAKQQDNQWVSRQNPSYYTIQITEDTKPSQVAKKLNQVPKNNRAAEIRAINNGQASYKGVYGTFNSYEEAQSALNALPPDIKQGAGIKQWSAIQGTMN